MTTLLLLQAGYAYVPYSSLESVIENSKEAYYLALRQTQATIRKPAPNWQPWLIFFLRSLDQQKRRLAIKIEREKMMVAALPNLSVEIVEYVRQHGRATMGEIIRLTGGESQHSQGASRAVGRQAASRQTRHREGQLVCASLGFNEHGLEGQALATPRLVRSYRRIDSRFGAVRVDQIVK